MIFSPKTPSPLDNPYTNFPSSYLIDAEMPSIFGSEESSISLFKFKKFFIFFSKSNISFLSKAFDKDSICLECFIFSNLPDGLNPTVLVIPLGLLRKEYCFSRLINSFFSSSNARSDTIGLSFSKYALLNLLNFLTFS